MSVSMSAMCPLDHMQLEDIVWGASQARQYAKLYAQTGIPKQLHDIREASRLAARLFDCVLNRHCDELRWSHADLDWE